MTYPGITLDRGYFVGGAWPDYGRAAETLESDAEFMAQRLDLIGKRVGILGCGYGFSVAGLRLLDVDAWGIDVSDWAISNTPAKALPFVLMADATSRDGMDEFASIAADFDVLIDENLLPLLADEEAVSASAIWREYAPEVIHLINMCREQPRTYDPGLERDGARHNWHSPSEWRALLGPGDRLIEQRTWEEHP